MAGEDEDVTIDLRLRDYLSTGAKVAAEEMEELAQNTRKASRALLLFEKRADKAANTLLKLAAATAAYNRQQMPQLIHNLDTVNKRLTTYTDNNKKLSKAMQLLDGQTRRTSKETKQLTQRLKLVGVAAMGAAKAFGMLGAAMAVAGGVSGAMVLLQSLYQIGAALVPLLSFASLLPTAFGSMIAIVGTLVVAFQGLGDAMAAVFSGKPEELAEALKNLSPAAASFVKEFMPFVKQLKEMQKLVQDSFFKPMVGALTPLLKVMIPNLTLGMSRLAYSIGQTAAEFMKWLATAQGQRMVNDIFKSATVFMDNLRFALKPLMGGFSDLIRAVMPFWERFSVALGDVLGQFGQWLTQISESGQLAEWLEKGIQTAGELFDILKLVGGILHDLMTGMGGMGGFGGIVSLLETVKEFTSSVEGQEAISSFFESFNQVMKALAPILPIVANAIGDVLAPAIADIVTALAPGFITLLQALSDALANLGPLWEPLATAIGDLLKAIAPSLPVIGQLALYLGTLLVGALNLIVPIIAAWVRTFAPIAEQLLPIFLQALQQLMPWITMFGQIFANVLTQLSPMLTQLGQLLATSLTEFLVQVSAMLPTVMPQLMELAMVVGQLLVQALTTLAPHIPVLLQAFFQLAGAGLQLLVALMPIIVALTEILAALIPIMPYLMQGAILFIGLAVAALTTASMVIGAFAKILGAVIDTIAKITGAVAGVTSKLSGPFVAAKNIIVGVFNDIKGAISSTIGKVGELASKISGIDLNPFRFAGGPVDMGQKYTVGEIGPELFVPNIGQPEMIGTKGMETRSFPSSGMIIPSFMVDAFDKIEKSMAHSMDVDPIVTDDAPSRELARIAAALEAGGGGENTYNVDVTINGNVSSEVDIEAAVERAIKKIERDKKERGF